MNVEKVVDIPSPLSILDHDSREEIQMRIRIGGLEILDPTQAELDDLIRRYGGQNTAYEAHVGTVLSKNGAQIVQGAAADQVVLRSLVEAGESGVPTTTIGDMLGRRGKATYRAAVEWARRIGLVAAENHDPFERCRVGVNRGIRIKPSLMGVARAILDGQGKKAESAARP